MTVSVSCGVVICNARNELFLCHGTGTARWDLPKGLMDPGESPLDTAVRETWEETSLSLEPGSLTDLGRHDYLRTKRLHLFALRVADDAVPIEACCCHSTFPHRLTGLLTLEADAYAWVPPDRWADRCGKNLVRVLVALDWPRIRQLPEVASVAVRATHP